MASRLASARRIALGLLVASAFSSSLFARLIAPSPPPLETSPSPWTAAALYALAIFAFALAAFATRRLLTANP